MMMIQWSNSCWLRSFAPAPGLLSFVGYSCSGVVTGSVTEKSGSPAVEEKKSASHAALLRRLPPEGIVSARLNSFDISSSSSSSRQQRNGSRGPHNTQQQKNTVGAQVDDIRRSISPFEPTANVY